MNHRHFSLGFTSHDPGLSNEAYDELSSRTLDVFVRATADAFITRPNGDILLGFRTEEPCGNQWWYIGGRMKTCESQVAAVVRNLKRETGMVFTPERFEPLGGYSLAWPVRKQHPQENGCHDSSNLFLLGFTDEEAQKIRLNSRDFAGQKWYSPDQIITGNFVNPLKAAVLDVRALAHKKELFRAIDTGESWMTIASAAHRMRLAEAAAKALET